MNSKERVLCAFAHKQPDQVPVDFGGMCCSMINAKIIRQLREHFGLPHLPPRINDMSVMTAYVEDDLADCLGCDVRQLNNYTDTYGHVNADWKEWRYMGEEVLIPKDCTVRDDGKGGYYVYPQGDTTCAPSGYMPPDGLYFNNLTRSPEFDEDAAEPGDNAEDYGMVTDEQIAFHKRLIDGLLAQHKAVQVAPAYMGLGDANAIPGAGIKNPKGIRAIDEWYMAPLLYPDYVHSVFDLGVERSIQNLSKYWEAFGDQLDIVYICGTDFGTQRGPMISSEQFSEFYLPYYKRLNDWIHTHTTWKTLKHCCGGIYELLPLLIESGFDAINPVQCSADGMEPSRLKQQFGRDVVFWGGGVDTQHTLPFGTPEEVRRQALERLEIFSKDGGYIFGAIHNVQANTPLPNLLALLDAVKEFNGTR